MAKLTREENLTKIIDELLVLFKLYDKREYNIVNKALEEVAESIKNNPSKYPVTVSLYRYMQDNELV